VNAYLQDTLADPEMVAVDSSAARGRLLLSNEVAALGLDVANTAGASNTGEKLLSHQIALAHKIALEEAAQASKERDPALQIKRLQTSARMMNTFQNGVLTLHRLRTAARRGSLSNTFIWSRAGSRWSADGNRFGGTAIGGTACSRRAARLMPALGWSIKRIDRLSSTHQRHP
jgi:hypothetical protein